MTGQPEAPGLTLEFGLSCARAGDEEAKVAPAPDRPCQGIQREMEALLQDPQTTNDERVRAANLYRLHGEPAKAVALLDAVLKADPGYSSAVAIRAFLLAEKEPARFRAIVRNPAAVTPGAKMPAQPGYDDATLDALTAYFKRFAPSVKDSE